MKFDWKTEKVGEYEVTYFNYDAGSGPNSGTEYKATQNPDGTFNVNVHKGSFEKIPYIGSFDTYMDMDGFASRNDWEDSPIYVCHVDHNEENAYVFWAHGESYYIRIDE